MVCTKRLNRFVQTMIGIMFFLLWLLGCIACVCEILAMIPYIVAVARSIVATIWVLSLIQVLVLHPCVQSPLLSWECAAVRSPQPTRTLSSFSMGTNLPKVVTIPSRLHKNPIENCKIRSTFQNCFLFFSELKNMSPDHSGGSAPVPPFRHGSCDLR